MEQFNNDFADETVFRNNTEEYSKELNRSREEEKLGLKRPLDEVIKDLTEIDGIWNM